MHSFTEASIVLQQFIPIHLKINEIPAKYKLSHGLSENYVQIQPRKIDTRTNYAELQHTAWNVHLIEWKKMTREIASPYRWKSELTRNRNKEIYFRKLPLRRCFENRYEQSRAWSGKGKKRRRQYCCHLVQQQGIMANNPRTVQHYF